jgi:KaiC/GvpD/RAD55 family RecA-like ATPase
LVQPRIRAVGEERATDRVPTCIAGLDERMGGGIPKGFLTLVAGPVGSMKSSVAYSMALRAARGGARSLYLSLEQEVDSIQSHMKGLGLDSTGVKEMHVVDLASVRKDISDGQADWLEALCTLLERYRKEKGLDVLVLDSMDALYSLVEIKNPRKELFHFFRRLRALGATTLLITEMGMDDRRFGKHGVEEFLSDGILHLRLKEVEAANVTSVRRYVGVVKMRRTRHDTDYHPFLVTRDGFELVLE